MNEHEMSTRAHGVARKVDVRLAALGWRKGDLARRMDMTQSSLSYWLSKEEHTTSQLGALAHALGIDIRVFFAPGLPESLLSAPAPPDPQETDANASEEN